MPTPLHGDSVRPVVLPTNRQPLDLDLPDASWMRDAVCASIDGDAFFPGVGESTAKAKAVCRRCPVREECLAAALAEPGDEWGVRGGLGPRERRALRKRGGAA